MDASHTLRQVSSEPMAPQEAARVLGRPVLGFEPRDGEQVSVYVHHGPHGGSYASLVLAPGGRLVCQVSHNVLAPPSRVVVATVPSRIGMLELDAPDLDGMRALYGIHLGRRFVAHVAVTALEDRVSDLRVVAGAHSREA